MTSRIKRRTEASVRLIPEKRNEKPGAEEERPVFSFRYLSMDVSVKRCDNKVFRKFIGRLRFLSEMTWKEINASERHQYGWELIERDSLKPRKSIPQVFSDVNKFYVFRYDSDNHPFICVVKGNVVYPIFIEAVFNDVYNHG